MKNDLLAYRHIGISEKDEEKMLQKIGVKSLDELIDKTIPANIRLKEPLALPKTMTEYEFGQQPHAPQENAKKKNGRTKERKLSIPADLRVKCLRKGFLEGTQKAPRRRAPVSARFF